MPDFSTLSRRQKTLAVNIPYRGSQGPLHLLIPSHRCKQRLPGDGQHWIKVEGEGALLSYDLVAPVRDWSHCPARHL